LYNKYLRKLLVKNEVFLENEGAERASGEFFEGWGCKLGRNMGIGS